MRIRGKDLSPEQRRMVLRAYTYRLTTENGYPQRNPTGARVPAISDAEWLEQYAFFITKDERLDGRYHYCEPVYMADAS